MSSYIEVWFTDQNTKPLDIKHKININLVINYSGRYKKQRAIQFKQARIFEFSLLQKMWAKFGKNWVVNTEKNFLIIRNNTLQMHLKLSQKEQIKNSGSN